ncbi:MAG: hypothetical protein ACE366_16630 [Bradymonadia bacterium]
MIITPFMTASEVQASAESQATYAQVQAEPLRALYASLWADPHRTAGVYARACGLGEIDALRRLNQLQRLGLVESSPVEWIGDRVISWSPCGFRPGAVGFSLSDQTIRWTGMHGSRTISWAEHDKLIDVFGATSWHVEAWTPLHWARLMAHPMGSTWALRSLLWTGLCHDVALLPVAERGVS